jgi:hypothetical protein
VWPDPSVASITAPIDLGPFEDAVACRVLFLRRHALFGGATGAGKSGGLNVLMGNLVACTDVVIWGIDLNKGMELGPWAECIDRFATTATRPASCWPMRSLSSKPAPRCSLSTGSASGNRRRTCPR